jgi:hypothetical protein
MRQKKDSLPWKEPNLVDFYRKTMKIVVSKQVGVALSVRVPGPQEPVAPAGYKSVFCPSGHSGGCL